MKWLMKNLRAFAWVLGLLLGTASALGQVVLPVEFRHVHQGETWLNFQSQKGVPISRTTNVPPGSNGLQPKGNESTGVFVSPTAGQFQGLLSFGAAPGLTQTQWLDVSNSPVLRAGTNAFSGLVAKEMGLPQAEADDGVIILRRAAVGAPYFSRRVSFAFGQVIPPPTVDETGAVLPELKAGSYWLAEPYTTTGHTNSGYYWSPHARKVYAVQPGPIRITWVKATPYLTNDLPRYTNRNGPDSFRTDGANSFLLYTENYIVSGSAAKPPRRMYWTQKGFQNIGKPIVVPAARVGAVNIIYHNNFPQVVASEFRGIGSTSPTVGTTNQALPELRTLWYEQQEGVIYAYNQEGRVFVELLGDLRSDGQTYVPLGTEIVDVFKQPLPLDVRVELGERILPPENASVDELDPEPLNQVAGPGFAFRHDAPEGGKVEYYATRATQNLNDFLVHWIETGEAGLRWPKLFGRYQLVWPREVGKYSLYVRPEVTSETEAQATAVVLDPENVPVIEYQDPLDFPRAKFTSDFRFYTFLDVTQPAHRTLLRYNVGEHIGFERVFSWRAGNLRTTNFAASPVATSLTNWNGSTWVWPDSLQAPRVEHYDVDVGDRIHAPAGEPGGGAGSEYLAGYLNQAIGNSFNPHAYLDPFAVGFEAANQGAIIPVNAIPDRKQLEVWWFRPSNARAGLNTGNGLLGFRTHFWPSVIGRYTLHWPSDAREIVLASKKGGEGLLTTAEQHGTIYRQHDPALPGYNPNEEHAIMNGGIPFATRDDLNILSNTSGPYSSEPFVLVDYRANDGRPAMAVFQLLREKPEAGWVFDYLVPAGQLIQPPPPLNFLQKPIEGSGDSAFNYNTEPPNTSGDLPGGWTNGAAGPYTHYQRFTYRDRKHDFWVYRGPHAGLVDLEAGTYDVATGEFRNLGSATAVVGQPFRFTLHTSRQTEFLELTVTGAPTWLTRDGFTLEGPTTTNAIGTNTLELVVRDRYDDTRVTNHLSLKVVDAGGVVAGQEPLAIKSTNRYTGSIVTFTNRPPFLARNPDSSNSFTLRYYYKTEPNFDWPGMATPPAPGSIVPYLRPVADGHFKGDAHSKATESLDIVYRPFWPVSDPKESSKELPTLPYAATLTRPAFNLPGVRDFKTAHILYQQSIAANITNVAPSAVLHDPTRAKYSEVTNHFPDTKKIPKSIYTTRYRGKDYFPNLPPHLAERVYFDPNRSPNGQLVFLGEFQGDDIPGGNRHSLLLNVLRGSDLAAVRELCPAEDKDNRKNWEALVDSLATDVETFHENPAVPGTYLPDPDLTESVGVGALAEVSDDNIAVDSYALSAIGPGGGYLTLVESGGTAFTQPGDPVALHIFKVGGSLEAGRLKVITSDNPLSELVTLQHTADMAGRFDEFEYEWKIAAPVDGQAPKPDATMSNYRSLTNLVSGLPRYTLGGAGIEALGDNYVVLRFRPIKPNHPLYNQWSDWTAPALAEGWIKRVLAGINPFNQRVTDLSNNRANTDVSLLTQAGRRWEGDVALNLDTLNDYGLIEIYETVLRRGRGLSIESGFNYGPANDGLLLAAGYLSDLYMMLGNEAWADAANPTIGIGTADNTYGDIATALFAFRGQVPSLLEEELVLLRGRDDFLLPGVEETPFYNRLIWNYTRGIDAGEVIYALNYNIQENPDQEPDGIINAEDAARMFPQGHGDAYGHYLTAIKGYYSLLLNANFDWVPRIEAVNVLNQPVSVDYQDERKFAAAAAAAARAGRQIFDLTWRQDYQPVHTVGWLEFARTRENATRGYTNTTDGGLSRPVRHWGLDHWASRVGQGTYLNWVVGNAILPEEDPIPTHEGIQKVDRLTVPELRELTVLGAGLQTALDNAEGGLSPLGLPEDGLAFDLNPNTVMAQENGAHFEQIYQRARIALQNAIHAFDDAKDVTRLMRSEQDSLADLQAGVARQERAYINALVDLYGTAYPDDIGPGKTYQQGYEGPDLLHYSYVDLPEYDIPELWSYSNTTRWEFEIKDVPYGWAEQADFTSVNLPTIRVGENGNDDSPRNGILLREVPVEGSTTEYQTNFVFSVDIGPHGFFEKPAEWSSRRRSPGQIQQAISEVIAAHGRLRHEINDTYGDLGVLDKTVQVFNAAVSDYQEILGLQQGIFDDQQVLEKTKFANDLFQLALDSLDSEVEGAASIAEEALPKVFIAGVASGGDLTSAARSALKAAGLTGKIGFKKVGFIRKTAVSALELAVNTAKDSIEFFDIASIERRTELRDAVQEIVNQLGTAQDRYWAVNQRVREYDDAKRRLQKLIADGDRIQVEREAFRRRSAAVVQGYRTRDAAFRLFRDEKLERYKTLFDLAAQYSLLAANAYDYDTGLLGTPAGRDFKRRIISARALGVVRNGEPQFAGSNRGDPGLSGVLAEMKADWDVLRGRLGFNNPDAYGTTVSLRTELHRILPGADGSSRWKDVLHQARRTDLLSDPDVRRYCLQIGSDAGLPVPGLVLSFGTTISRGYNLFGLPLAAGDHAFDPSSFATKIFAVGVVLDGYVGMERPAANSGTTGGASAAEPGAWFLDPLALAATPYLYLVPVGVDSMRSPPLGDASAIRTWSVQDLAIPLPFNIGASSFTTGGFFQSADSLSEPLFTLRKHQAFRPVSREDHFPTALYHVGELFRSQYTNNRLIGRSVWNSQWKLIIPGHTLLNDPNEGLDRFIRTVGDIKLHFVTYSYSGN